MHSGSLRGAAWQTSVRITGISRFGFCSMDAQRLLPPVTCEKGRWSMPAVLLRSTVRLGSGLSCVAPDEIDTIVIAGMGGETILSILEAAPWTNDARYTLLLQPMTKAEVLRPWLSEQGYVFLKERLVLENRTYFPIMALRGGGTGQPLSIGQAWGGVALQDDPLQGNALDALLHLCTYALNGLERSTVPKNLERAAQQRAILVQLRRMKEEWLHANGKRT